MIENFELENLSKNFQPNK